MLILYIYTIFLFAALFTESGFCLAGYAVSRSDRYLHQASLLVVYLLELVVVFGAEWLIQNLPDEIGANYYGIELPWLHIAQSCALAYLFWLTVQSPFGRSGKKPGVICSAFLGAAQVFIVACLPYGPLRQWLFYISRTLALVLAILWSYLSATVSPAEERPIYKRYIPIYTALLMILITSMLEDYWVVMVAPTPSESTDSFVLLLSHRNIPENAAILATGLLSSRRALRLIAAHFSRPVGFEDHAVEREQEPVEEQIRTTMPAFADAYALTTREKEVLRLILLGSSNREISQRLYVVEGTVKTHTHNLIKKVGAANREELRQIFWSF